MMFYDVLCSVYARCSKDATIVSVLPWRPRRETLRALGAPKMKTKKRKDKANNAMLMSIRRYVHVNSKFF